MSDLDLAALGANVRRTRRARGLTLKAVERASGVSATHVSEIERGKTSPTVGALERIASALGVAVTRLLETVADAGVQVVRADSARRLALDVDAMTLGPLSSGAPGRCLSFFDVRLSPGRDVEPRPERRLGEEVIVVLAGSVDLIVGREHASLQTGDTLHVRTRGRLRFTNPGREEARALWVTSPRYAL